MKRPDEIPVEFGLKGLQTYVYQIDNCNFNISQDLGVPDYRLSSAPRSTVNYVYSFSIEHHGNVQGIVPSGQLTTDDSISTLSSRQWTTIMLPRIDALFRCLSGLDAGSCGRTAVGDEGLWYPDSAEPL